MVSNTISDQSEITLVLNREDYCGYQPKTLGAFRQKLEALLGRAGLAGEIHIRVFSYRLRRAPFGLSMGMATEDGLEIVYADGKEGETEQVWVLRCDETERPFLRAVLEKEIASEAKGLPPLHGASGRAINSTPLIAQTVENLPPARREPGMYWRTAWSPSTTSAPARDVPNQETSRQPVKQKPEEGPQKFQDWEPEVDQPFRLIPSTSVVMQDLPGMAKTLSLLISRSDENREIERGVLTEVLRECYGFTERQAVANHQVMKVQKFIARNYQNGKYRILNRADAFIQEFG